MQTVFGGLRVIEFSQGMAGSMAAMMLADNGAEVIKVEPPAGDWSRQSPGFLMWNRGKKSITLDFNEKDSLRKAVDLALTADVVLGTTPVTAAKRYGLDFESLSAQRPELIYCSISGFGLAARHEALPPREALVLARSGRVNGNDKMSGANFSDRPIFITSPFASFGAAGLAVQGICAALFARIRTGKGQNVETSLLDGASITTMRLAFERQGNRVVVLQKGASALIKRGILLCFMTARCKDGRYIQMCARQDQHFRNWLHAVELGQLLEEERFSKAPLGFKTAEDVDELERLIRERMSTRSFDEWIELFSNQWDVGADPFLTPAEFLQHPQMILNERIVKIEDARHGTVTQIGPLALFSDTPSVIDRSAPDLGEHQADLPTLLEARPPRSEWELRKRAAPSEPSQGPPLDGVTVLELAYYLATPLGATQLGELGARVIKVEPLAGDPYRKAGLEIVHLVNGKESLPVDLKQEDGREIVRRLAAMSDALIHNFRPGAAERLGVDYETMRRVNPRLIYLYGASYGSKGPQSHRPAFHSTPHALCGGGILQAGLGNPPVDDSYPDTCAGVAVGIALVMALVARERTGRGQYIETTMLTSSGYVHSERLTHYRGMPRLPMLDGSQRGLHALHRLYRTSDGWLMLAALRQVEWQRLVEALGNPEWGSEPRFLDHGQRLENDPALIGLLEDVFMQKDAQAWERILNDVGVPAAAVGGSFQEFMVDSGLVDGEEHPAFGTYWRLKPRTRFSRSPNRHGFPCAVGEHTVKLLDELGYGAKEIERLIGNKVVAAAQFHLKG